MGKDFKTRFVDVTKFPHSIPYISEPNSIPNDDYHNSDKYSAFLSSTSIKAYEVSPLWFKYTVENGGKSISKEAQVWGNAYHDYMASLANTKSDAGFMREYEIFDEPKNPTTQKPYGLDTKKYEETERIVRESSGKTPLGKSVYNHIKEMVLHLLYGNKENSKDIRTLIKYGFAERSYFCEYLGVYFKFRKDLSTGKKIIDWKAITADDLHADTIRKIIFDFGYDLSAAFYQFFDHEITGEWKYFYWVFQQKTPPYDFVLVDSQPFTYQFATEEINGKKEKIVTDVGIGARKFHALLDQHIHCVENNYWPGAAIFIPEETFGINRGKRIMQCEIPLYQSKDIIFYNE